MAGTTRLELATSAVTGSNNKYLQQLTRLLGTAKYLKIPRSRIDLRSVFGLESSEDFDGPTLANTCQAFDRGYFWRIPPGMIS
jgi:hypothetical protein